MAKQLTTGFAAAIILLMTASCAVADGTLVSIHSSAYFALNNVRFAIIGGQGETIWADPASTDWGSFGVYAANDDPIDQTIAGPPGGKMRTNPEGPGWPYYTHGPHYTGPFWVNSLATASGVGPEFLDHWVGFRIGSATHELAGVRFDATCYYDPAEFRLEVWAIDPAGVQFSSIVASLAPPAGQAISYEFAFEGYKAVELRMVIGAVPEPSSCAAVAVGLLGALRAMRRRPR